MVQQGSFIPESAASVVPQRVHQTEWVPVHRNGAIMATVASRNNYLFAKRAFDILLSVTIILAVMSWLVPLLWVFIKLNSKGPAFFLQKRIGRNNRMFCCIKFRTMVVNHGADEIPANHGDERITAVGKFLRRTNLDELPQFFNVLLGQMSVVGPRPHMPADCIRFSFIISSYSFRHLVRPGITGWAQVNGYHGPTPDYKSVMYRYYWDAMYVRRKSILLDLKILLTTTRQFILKLFGLPSTTTSRT